MAKKMVRTQVYLPHNIYEQLKQHTEAEDLTMGHQIREALTEYMVGVGKEEEKGQILTEDDPIWNIIGMVESGITDGSVNHDRYIYFRAWESEEKS